MQDNSYTIVLDQFEGPFDLLLFFIRRDELDIHDIPISKITDDFLDYIHQVEALNLDLASEFILVAATLIRIKTKMLLPRRPLDEDGEEIDPRDELVAKLLEYKKYKDTIPELKRLEEEQMTRHQRGSLQVELARLSHVATQESTLDSITLYKLLQAFEAVMTRLSEKGSQPIHRVYRYPYRISNQKDDIITTLKSNRQPNFKDLFTVCENRVHAIVRFLAILEMLNEHSIKLIQGDGHNNFWIELL